MSPLLTAAARLAGAGATLVSARCWDHYYAHHGNHMIAEVTATVRHRDRRDGELVYITVSVRGVVPEVDGETAAIDAAVRQLIKLVSESAEVAS